MENVEKNNEVKKGKYIKIYTRSMMKYMHEKGCILRDVQKSEKDPKRMVWFFERTPFAEQIFEEYINKPKTSAFAEDTNK